jgi:putative sigma-54 modulation protein
LDLLVVGKHTEIDSHLRALTEEKVTRIEKFANDVRRVDVEYRELAARKAGDSHTCEILVHLNQHLVKGSASAAEHPAALDRAVEKVEQQMRRLHDRRVHRRNGARGSRAAVVDEDDEDAESGEDGQGPRIVKIKQFEVKPMTAEEAALQMELLSHDFFLFRSTETGHAAVVYRRRDGAFGLIEVTG